MSISTKTGDKGFTSLPYAKRFRKNSSRLNAVGTVDELNSYLGLILSSNCSKATKTILIRIQHELFIMGSDLSTSLEKEQKRISSDYVKKITDEVLQIEKELNPLKNFILPDGCKIAANLHIAKSICRRAERSIVELEEKEKINTEIIKYLNRLSDLLFLLARIENKNRNISDTKAEF